MVGAGGKEMEGKTGGKKFEWREEWGKDTSRGGDEA